MNNIFSNTFLYSGPFRQVSFLNSNSFKISFKGSLFKCNFYLAKVMNICK